MPRPITNRMDKQYGYLRAVRFDHQGRGGTAYWLFRCICGTDKVLNAVDVAKGNVKSCGCKKLTLFRQAIVLPDGLAARHSLYLSYQQNARSRRLTFDIPEQEFADLTKRDCFYCGVEPRTLRQPRGSTPYFYNGLDRIDNRLGYTVTNVVPCCRTCNMAKHAMTQQQFLEWVERLCKFRFGGSRA